MKTSHISSSRLAALALGLGFSFGAAQFAYAGPGPDYWRGQKSAAPTVEGTSSLPPCGMTCADSKTVQITETRNAWRNGRGPLETVVVGTKEICESCKSTTTVMKPSLPNGRGPMHAVTVATPHVCRISVPTKQG